MYKEYEVKKKNGTRAMTPVRNEVLIRLSHKSCYFVGEWTFGGGGAGFSK